MTSPATPPNNTRRVVITAGVLAAVFMVMFVIDAAAGGKHPLALTAVGFGGAAVLITVAVLVPGGVLARPEGTRAGELGVDGDRASSLDDTAPRHTPVSRDPGVADGGNHHD